GSLFNCTPGGASFFGVDAIKECREIENAEGTKVLNNCSMLSAVALSNPGKYVPVTWGSMMSTTLATLSTSVFPFISMTPITSLPLLGVSETAIRQLKSWKFFQSSTCG